MPVPYAMLYESYCTVIALATNLSHYVSEYHI